MKLKDIRICVLRAGGTNCDSETQRAFTELGIQTEIVHTDQIMKKRILLNYDALVLPGGFAYGDYVRAGAIWAKRLFAKLDKQLKVFLKEEKPILGICNGFQVLVEAGLLPAFGGISEFPEAALAPNDPPGYSCRWICVRQENAQACQLTKNISKGTVLRVPIAHSEGRFMLAKENRRQLLKKLQDNDQLVFRYCTEKGEPAGGSYPTNPNGSFHDIAGICNPEGTVLGLMPHPERAFYWWQTPDWTTQAHLPEFGDGKLVIEGLVNYLAKKF